MFAESMLSNERFRSICRAAILEKRINKSAFVKTFRNLLESFTSNLARDPQNQRHLVIISFLQKASSSIANRVVRLISVEEANFGLDESSVQQLGETDRRARVAEFINHMEKVAGNSAAPTQQAITDNQADSDSNDDESSVGDIQQQDDAAIDGLYQVEALWYSSNAFDNFTRQLHEYVHPSLRSILMGWISKQRRDKHLRNKQLQDLEVLVSELQHVAPDQILTDVNDTTSVVNYLKGIVEDLTGETWDWWPLKPRMRALGKGEVRLRWECVRNPTFER